MSSFILLPWCECEDGLLVNIEHITTVNAYTNNGREKSSVISTSDGEQYTVEISFKKLCKLIKDNTK